MARKKHSAEQIVAVLRQIEVDPDARSAALGLCPPPSLDRAAKP
jgi:hypothetical protein